MPNHLGRGTESVRAFTLIELLVVIACIGVLVAILIPVLGAARSSADRATAVTQMRQIGVALHTYSVDNAGNLPGPMWPGQIPQLDPNRDGRMVRQLAPYLGVTRPETPQVIAQFVPPAYRKVQGEAALPEARTYVLNMAVDLGDNRRVDPWGNLAAGAFPNPPLKLSSLPPQAWALSDADQLHPRVRNASWRSFTPAQPIHGAARLSLHFGGAVMRIEETALQ